MKLKAFAAITAACVMTMAMTVFAATSPSSSSVTASDSSSNSSPTFVSTPGVLQTSSGFFITLNDVDATTATNMNVAAASYVANTFGPTAVAQTLMTKDVAKPDGYIQGTPISFTWNVSGIVAGDTIIVVHYGENGMEYVLPDSIQDGALKFTLTSLSPVSIIKVSNSATAVAATQAMVTGLTLPKTGDTVSLVFPIILAITAAGTMAAAATCYKKA